MGVADFLSGGSTPATVNGTANSFTQLPQWYQEYVQGIMAKGNAVAGVGFQQFPGVRVAQLNDWYNKAGANIESSMGKTDPLTGSAAGNLSAGSQQGLNTNTMGSYMSPYTDQVVNKISALGQRNLTENLLPQVNDTFTGSGQFGSGRHADFTARTVRDANESILNQQTDALNQGWNTALTQTQQDKTNALAGGQAQGALAKLIQGMDVTDSSQLMSMGQLQQGVDQANADYGYQQFTEQRDLPQQRLGFLNSLLRGMQIPTNQVGTTSQQTSQSTSPLAAMVGLAGLGTGAYSALR